MAKTAEEKFDAIFGGGGGGGSSSTVPEEPKKTNLARLARPKTTQPDPLNKAVDSTKVIEKFIPFSNSLFSTDSKAQKFELRKL